MTAEETIDQAVNAIFRPYQVEGDIEGPSRLQTYLECPMKYRLRYRDRVAVTPRAESVLGTAIHAVIAHAHREHWTERRKDDCAEMLEGIWDEVGAAGADDPDVLVSFRQARDVWIPQYLQWTRDQETLVVEERWQVEVEMDDPEEPFSLRGTIDRVYQDRRGRVVVSDVKSGKRAPSRSDVAVHLQLGIYAWAVQQVSIAPGSEVLELVHLRGFADTGKQHSFKTLRTPEYLDAVMDHTVIPCIRGIRAGHFPANPGGLYGCDHCDVQHSCPIGQGGEVLDDDGD